jgi:molecular chaperone GrpE
MALRNPFRRNPKAGTNMDNEHVKHEEETQPLTETPADPSGTTDNVDNAEGAADSASASLLEAELDVLRTEHQALHDKHIRLYAEFDNFRKRTAKEKLELMQFAGENVLAAVLPVVDDLERAVANNEQVDDIASVKDGVKLIHQKLVHILAGQGLKPLPDAKGQPFDTDRHEAITKAPAPSEALKGKVIDVVENGFTLHDKVIRYAKVVVGE